MHDPVRIGLGHPTAARDSLAPSPGRTDIVHSCTLARGCHAPAVAPAGSSPPTRDVAQGCGGVPLPLRPVGSPGSHPVSPLQRPGSFRPGAPVGPPTLECALIPLPHDHAQQPYQHDACDQPRRSLHRSPRHVILPTRPLYPA
jgi:hypothetical protein